MNNICIEVYARNGSKPLFARLVECPVGVSFPFQQIVDTMRVLFQPLDIIVILNVSQFKNKTK